MGLAWAHTYFCSEPCPGLWFHIHLIGLVLDHCMRACRLTLGNVMFEEWCTDKRNRVMAGYCVERALAKVGGGDEGCE